MNESLFRDVEAKITKLRDDIRHHDHLYYVLAEPVLSDYEYDQLMLRLQQLEVDHPQFITLDSPTKRVGGSPVNRFSSVEHTEPMLSLANCYDSDELRDFDRRVRELFGDDPEYVCELKIDGVALKLIYKDRHLVTAATRGNGLVGDDITENVRTIRSIPLSVPDSFPDEFEVIGEVYYPLEEFKQMNERRISDGLNPFMNPRNGAAGTLKLLDSREVAMRPLRFWAYGLSGVKKIETHIDSLILLSDGKFPVNSNWELSKSIDDVEAYWTKWNREHFNIQYDTDGIVIKLNSILGQHNLGATAKSPRWAIAYKYSAQMAITRITDVTWQVGRTGTLTPVADLEPILLLGTIVKRATLHNMDEIERLDIRIGDQIEIKKGGDVIPKVTGVIIENRSKDVIPITPPKNCPICDSTLEKTEGEVALRCPNWDCEDRVKGRIIHFASRNGMDIEGLGAKTVETLVQEKYIIDAGDLFSLTADQIESLPRQAEISAQNLLKGIAESNKKPFNRLLFALGIRYVGSGVARTLASTFDGLESLKSASQEELEAIPEIGTKIAASVIDYFRSAPNCFLIDKLKQAGIDGKGSSMQKISQSLAGKIFVLTGTLADLTREQVAEMIREHGGRITSSVSKKTDYVLVGMNPGSKLAKAQKLNISIIDEQSFLALIE